MNLNESESPLVEFFSECEEIIVRFSARLSTIEKNGKVDEEEIGALYRDMHTLKGSSQLFGFQSIGLIAHSMEASLEPFRRLKLQIPQRLVEALFNSVGLVDRILKKSSISSINKVQDFFEDEVNFLVPLLIMETSNYFGGEIEILGESLTILERGYENKEELKCRNREEILSISDFPRKQRQFMEEPTMAVEVVIPSNILEGNHIDDNQANIGADKNANEISEAPPSEVISTIRVQVGLLDKLMNLVGEMVLVRNQMLLYTQSHDAPEFLNLSQRLNLVTSELQEEVIKTRMQPIGNILEKFNRVVRDLAKELEKKIEMTIQGYETELDKTLLEAIKDPLTHIIRNCCDHGIEGPEERVKSGKPQMANINIRAFHEGGQVVIEISDDGRGLNNKRILEKALEKNIITQDKALTLTEREIGNLIFAPGFSTAEKVSSLSGRGVGMDVVKTNLEKVGGQVELHSIPKKGMTVRLRIPLTLAIVPALIVRIGKEQFAIPQVKLVELVRLEKDGHGPKMELLQGRLVFRLRGHLLSLVNLGDLLGLNSPNDVDIVPSCVNIVVLNGESGIFGLIVDEIKDTADIVVKPLTSFLKKISIYSGATIMGDGKVSLILDITGIAQKAHLFQKNARVEFATGEAAKQLKESKKDLDVQDFLFFNLNSSETYSIPLILVNRLEEFPSNEIKFSGSQKIVKYRDSILPIISLNEILGLGPSKLSSDKISVIVVQRRSKLYGFEVNEIIDISNVKGEIEDTIQETSGILGSIIMEKNVSTVVDILGILEGIVGESPSEKISSDQKQNKIAKEIFQILHVEDTTFFRNQVRKILVNNGFKVVTVNDGVEAWKILSSSQPGEYQLVLSDIEMPHMDGFELAKKIRQDSRFTTLPLIALTTKYRQIDKEKGSQLGFSHYLEKLHHDNLIAAINDVLQGNKL